MSRDNRKITECTYSRLYVAYTFCVI